MTLIIFAFLFAQLTFGQVDSTQIDTSAIYIKLERVDGERIVEFCDEEAQFPGGKVAMSKYIMNNINYPEEAILKNETGKVYIAFVVEKDGSLSNIVVERGATRLLDYEAYRVIKSMPNWAPGEYRGKTVRSRVRLPISFTLD